MSRILILSAASVAVALAAGSELTATRDARALLARDGHERPSARRPFGAYLQYGAPVAVGDGFARANVLYAQQDGGAPIEGGVALDARAMTGLPAANPQKHAGASDGHEHLDNHPYLLSLPGRGAAPFQFVELDWNPGGHEPPGVYDTPHFDFHFWTTSREARASIVPSDPQYQRKADMLPPEAQRPPFFAVAAPPGAPAPGVPLMGVHWVDVRTPELQKVFGKPEAWKPFTTTFLYGSWEGEYTFLEPMITREYIMAKKAATDPAVRDEVIPVPVPTQFGAPGYYPSAYRIAYDAESKQYRIALTQLGWRE